MLAGLERVRQDWGLTEDEEARLLAGGGLSGPIEEVESWRAGEMERRSRLLLEVSLLLSAVFPSNVRVRDWLRCPNRALGGATPLDRMSASPEWIRRCRDMLRWIQP